MIFDGGIMKMLPRHKLLFVSIFIVLITLFIIGNIFKSPRRVIPEGLGDSLTSYLESIPDSEWQALADELPLSMDSRYLLVTRSYIEDADSTSIIEGLTTLADNGHRLSQLALAELQVSNDIEEDDANGLASLQYLHAENSLVASLDLAYCYAEGKGVPRDDMRAISILESVYERGDVSDSVVYEFARLAARNRYLHSVSTGIWQKVKSNTHIESNADCRFLRFLTTVHKDGFDEDIANKLLFDSAHGGSRDARILLAEELISTGRCAVDSDVVFEWLIDEMKSGSAHAALLAYQSGILDVNESVEYLYKAIDYLENHLSVYQPETYRLLGEMYLELDSDEAFDDAVRCLTNASFHGDRPAQRLLAEIYVGTLHDGSDSSGHAFPLLLQLAYTGDEWAMFQLGDAFMVGWAPQGPNAFEAVRWFQLAFDNGSFEALLELEFAYRNGIGVYMNIDIADSLAALYLELESDINDNDLNMLLEINGSGGNDD